MQKLSEISQFQIKQNIVLQGFDPVSAGGFTQVPNAILKDPTLSLGAKFTYAVLLSYAWNNNLVYPGQETMAREYNMGKRSIVRFLAELEKKGLLAVQRRGQGRTNVYVLKHSVKKSRK